LLIDQGNPLGLLDAVGALKALILNLGDTKRDTKLPFESITSMRRGPLNRAALLDPPATSTFARLRSGKLSYGNMVLLAGLPPATSAFGGLHSGN
jgi:hypothetical protein